jgi:molybdate transport system regulatory protein
VQTYKGGKTGGGGANLTALGQNLLSEYKQLEGYLSEILSEEKISEAKNFKISAKTNIKGKVISVEKGVITAKIKIEVQVPAIITAVITKDAAEDLNLKIGDKIRAIVKATEVIIGK